VVLKNANQFNTLYFTPPRFQHFPPYQQWARLRSNAYHQNHPIPIQPFGRIQITKIILPKRMRPAHNTNQFNIPVIHQHNNPEAPFPSHPASFRVGWLMPYSYRHHLPFAEHHPTNYKTGIFSIITTKPIQPCLFQTPPCRRKHLCRACRGNHTSLSP
jgi:hypothetical protein